ncbi:MAG: glycosyltransferase [Acidobacteriales bacterium]|nr:glycosyltransferase [Terriglobales bacterium]
MRIAIVHYWLVSRRGGERVIEALAELFPHADIYTLVFDPDRMGGPLASRPVKTSFVQRIPGAKRHYQKLLPLFPLALESFDLSGYDLVISSESGPAKGVLTGARTCHVCYCHTPMRYLWDMYGEYRRQAPGGALGRLFFSLVTHYLRMWDLASASRVDYFVANSYNVANRIAKTYRRSAEVIYPPVAVDKFAPQREAGDFYLVVSQLVGYKRVDIAIEACNRLQRKLVVIGDGEEFARLKRLAGPTVQMLGWQGEEVLKDHYARCRALLFPGEEDCGITPVEAQASGRPVIAFGRGGVLETVQGWFAGEPHTSGEERSGIFFSAPTAESLMAAMQEWENHEYQFNPQKIQEHAQQFSTERFKSEILALLRRALGEFWLQRSSVRRDSVCSTSD